MNRLFCEKEGPYSTVEHIVPESLGNKRLVLTGIVCDHCQNYLGKEVEEYVLRRSPIGAWWVLAGVQTKHGKQPIFSFRQPDKDSGRFPDRHSANDDSVTFIGSEEGDCLVEFDDKWVHNKVSEGTKTDFRLVLTPKMLHMMGRFLGKVGLEMLARDHDEVARNSRYNSLRRFVRFGQPTGFLWPLFHGTLAGKYTVSPVEIAVFDTAGLIQGGETYTLSSLRLGNEFYVVCLSDPYPHPVIRGSFPGIDLKAITY